MSLLKCKKQIIVPFRKLLCLVNQFHFFNSSIQISRAFFQIGWRPFGADNLKRPSIFLRIINVIYPIFIFLLLLFNYTYEVLLCQGKLNYKIDTQVNKMSFHFNSKNSLNDRLRQQPHRNLPFIIVQPIGHL